MAETRRTISLTRARGAPRSTRNRAGADHDAWSLARAGAAVGRSRNRMPDNPPSLDDVFSLAYEELRRLAATVRRNSPDSSLSPTALVHEAWLKLRRHPDVAPTSRLHFRRLAARAMRQVLVDLARRRAAGKRGAGAALVTYDDGLDAAATDDDVLMLHDALDALAFRAPRQARVVELRFFGGFDSAEIAAALDVAEATVRRDWRAARAWLTARLGEHAPLPRPSAR